MSWEQTIHAALQLQRDAGPMTSNFNVLQQYALSVHSVVLDILQSVFGRHYFPSTAVHDSAPVPCVCRASAHMAAIGLWRPPVGPGGPGLAVFHQGLQFFRVPYMSSSPIRLYSALALPDL